MERLDVEMSFEDIVHLINLIDKSQISFLELNHENTYLKLDKSLNRQVASENSVSSEKVSIKSMLDNNEIVEKIDEKIETINSNVSESCDDGVDYEYVVSPMVGTVYLSPSPGKQTYVCKGQHVKKGDVVCIVEAMKLMNEIESEYSGEIVEVLVKDSQMVEYGQRLFKVKYN